MNTGLVQAIAIVSATQALPLQWKERAPYLKAVQSSLTLKSLDRAAAGLMVAFPADAISLAVGAAPPDAGYK